MPNFLVVVLSQILHTRSVTLEEVLRTHFRNCRNKTKKKTFCKKNKNKRQREQTEQAGKHAQQREREDFKERERETTSKKRHYDTYYAARRFFFVMMCPPAPPHQAMCENGGRPWTHIKCHTGLTSDPPTKMRQQPLAGAPWLLA